MILSMEKSEFSNSIKTAGKKILDSVWEKQDIQLDNYYSAQRKRLKMAKV